MEHTDAGIELLNWSLIEQLCDHYMGGRPSNAILQVLKPLSEQRNEVRDCVRRAVQLMGISQLGARNFSPIAALALGMTSQFLPGAWNGIVPPITAQGRHKIIDDYISNNPWRTPATGTVMVDLGCGFPPLTAIEAAQRFPDWQIIGADPSFDPYLLYDRNQVYACVDQSGHIRYFQLQPGLDLKTMDPTLRDREGTIRRLTALFEQLLAKLPLADDGEMHTVESDGSRLIRRPTKQWESGNLRLIQAGIGSDSVPVADVIRCFNVLIYYDTTFRREFESWAASRLRDGGLVIAGTNSPNAVETYYSVYRKENGVLVEKEFAFSADNIRPLGLMPWFTIRESDLTSLRLARLIRCIRSDAEFCTAFDAQIDEVLRENRMMHRDADGSLAWMSAQLNFEMIMRVSPTVAEHIDREGLALRAADILSGVGVRAWRNEAGHVAVDPSALNSEFLNR
jgi:SAM-dependent methyltransferase